MNETLNTMEVYSLLVACITMYSGMYYITGSHYTYMNNNGLKWFFLVCLVIPNLMFFLYWLINMALEIMREGHKRGKKIFRVMTFGLVNYENFEKKYMGEFLEQ